MITKLLLKKIIFQGCPPESYNKRCTTDDCINCRKNYAATIYSNYNENERV